MKRSFLLICLTIFVSSGILSQDPDSIPVLNPLKYFDLGFGGDPYNGFGAANAGLSLDVNDVLALFIEYNMYFENHEIHFHETNIKIGPYIRFNEISFISLSGGFSFIFNTASRLTDSGSDNYMFNLPFQLKLNLGINKRISVGLKGNYNMMLVDADNMGSVVAFVSYKIWDW